MISDRRAAELNCAIYGRPAVDAAPIDFWHVDDGDDDGVYWALAREGDVDVVVLRGSVTIQDWLRDVMAVPSPYSSRRMGPVHPGFYLGLTNAWNDMQPILRPGAPIAITGHSLGAGRAFILAAIMVDEGIVAPASIVTFGSPKPGFAPLGELLSNIPARSYRNKHDAVTTLPFAFPPLDYVHPVVPIDVVESPLPGDSWGMFAFHHMELYLAALKTRELNLCSGT